MNNLEVILRDFFDCVYIPIRYTNDKFELIYTIKSSSSIDKFIDKVNLYKDIKESTEQVIKLTYYNNVHFIIIPILDKYPNGYFIAGPFKSGPIDIDVDMPFKPFYCIDYISNILRSIIKENLKQKSYFSEYIFNSISYIHNNYSDDIKIDDLCSYLNINKSYFCRLFKKEVGYTFSNFLNKFRVEKSKDFLSNKDYSILDVAMLVGYNNHNYYSSLFKKFNNVTPIDYRKNCM